MTGGPTSPTGPAMWSILRAFLVRKAVRCGERRIGRIERGSTEISPSSPPFSPSSHPIPILFSMPPPPPPPPLPPSLSAACLPHLHLSCLLIQPAQPDQRCGRGGDRSGGGQEEPGGSPSMARPRPAASSSSQSGGEEWWIRLLKRAWAHGDSIQGSPCERPPPYRLQPATCSNSGLSSLSLVGHWQEHVR